MAEGDSESFGFLTHKLGPMPVWMWAALAVGGYYWYTHYGPGASSQAAAQTAQVEQDNITTQPTYGGSQYKTNEQWSSAAISFLVGESIPATEATTAIYNYLHSKPLTVQEQRDVNLAVEGIGPPPTTPAPGQVETPPPPPKKGGGGGTGPPHRKPNPGGPNKHPHGKPPPRKQGGGGTPPPRRPRKGHNPNPGGPRKHKHRSQNPNPGGIRS